MLKLKKTLETASSTRSINDEMHLPLSEKHNRHINVAGFWKNIIAGLDEDTNRRRITLKRLTDEVYAGPKNATHAPTTGPEPDTE